MKNVDYMARIQKDMEQITKGAFLTVQADNNKNVMTIGWATIGFVWKRPVFMAAVRPTRYTFSLIEKSPDFSVSIPGEDMSEALAFCGSKSGRDYDKFAECKLPVRNAQYIQSPVLDIKGIHYECKTIVKTPMDPQTIDHALDTLYPLRDYHTLYYGEIVGCYEL